MEVIPPNLTEYQKAILFSDKRFTICEAATKCGKTYSHICWLFGKSMEPQPKPGANYWWVAPVYSQAEIAYNRLSRYLSGIQGFSFNASKLSVKTPQESVITFKTADKPDNLYGEDVYAAVFDEFTRSKPAAWYALRSTLTHTKAPCKLIGNYQGKSNWGHQLALKSREADSEYEYFKITAWDAVREGILSEEEVLQAQKDLPKSVFNALYLAEGGDTPDKLINDDAAQDIFTNNVEEGLPAITADVALQGSDRFVVMVWRGYRVVDMVVKDKSKGPEIIETIKNLIKKYNVQHSRVVYDSDGVGGFIDGFIPNAKSFHNGGRPVEVKGQKEEYRNLKSQCYFKIAKRINEGGIAVFDGEYNHEILQELETVRNRTFGKDGKLEVLRKEEVKELIGRSPDFSDALMMREYLDLKDSKVLSFGVL